MHPWTPSEWDITPFRLALLYLLFGLGALVVSDVVLPLVVGGPTLRAIQSVKGAVEVLLTAVFVYFLVRLSWRDLRLKERALDEAPVGITMTDAEAEDNPLIFANRQFEGLTGYEDSDVLGRNCRFLQGEKTDPEARRRLREAIDEERPVSVDIRNYRRTGEAFWNKVDVAPVRDDDGTVTNFVGFQTDITERKIREERFTVLNRVLRHNVRNRMNVIDGYLTVLRDDVDVDVEGDDAREAFERIEGAITELLTLVETVRHTESVLQATDSSAQVVRLDEQLQVVVDSCRARYPEATISLSLPDGEGYQVDSVGLGDAVKEAIENAIKHNEGPAPAVAVRVQNPRANWVEVEIEDDGPGIPDVELAVLEEGESPLTHGTRMGLWMIHWIVNRAGGTLSVSDAPDGGTVLRLSVPAATEESPDRA